MARTFVPRGTAAGAELIADCRVSKITFAGTRATGATCVRTRADGTTEPLTIRADHVIVCGGAIQTPALLQRSGIHGTIGTGLKFHPTIKVAARFGHSLDHGEVPMHRVMEFGPFLTIGGSASRKGHVALALADTSVALRRRTGRLAERRRLLRRDPGRQRAGAGRSRAALPRSSPTTSAKPT